MTRTKRTIITVLTAILIQSRVSHKDTWSSSSADGCTFCQLTMLGMK